MTFLTRMLTAALGAILLTVSAAHAETVVIGHPAGSVYETTASVYRIVLERSGYNVVMKSGAPEQLYEMLVTGECDLYVAALLPNAQHDLWSEHKEKLIQVAPLYYDVKQFWAVPAYVPASLVKSVADLATPEVTAKMQKTINGPGMTTSLMLRSAQLMQDYRLSEAGYELAPGTQQEWADAFTRNVDAQNWFVTPLWQPQYLNKVAKLRMLDDPKGVFGKPDTAWLIAGKAARAKFPDHIYDILKRMEFSVANVNELDYMVNVEKTPPLEAAHLWMSRHPYTIEYWLNM